MNASPWHPLAVHWRRRGGIVISEPFVDRLERRPKRRRRRYVKARQTPPPITFAAASLPPGDRE